MDNIVPLMEQFEPNDLLIFAHVAETGSFSRAAERIGLPKSTVSRRIAVLEERLGERLMLRTTRRLTLTELGEQLLAHARQVADEVDAVRALAEHRQARPERPAARLDAKRFRQPAADRHAGGLHRPPSGGDAGTGSVARDASTCSARASILRCAPAPCPTMPCSLPAASRYFRSASMPPRPIWPSAATRGSRTICSSTPPCACSDATAKRHVGP